MIKTHDRVCRFAFFSLEGIAAGASTYVPGTRCRQYLTVSQNNCTLGPSNNCRLVDRTIDAARPDIPYPIQIMLSHLHLYLQDALS